MALSQSGKKGGGKGLRGRSKPLPCGIIACSLSFRFEVLLDFEGGINVFPSCLEMAAKALVSFCLVPRKVPASLGERCLVTGLLQHPPCSPSFVAPTVLSQPKCPPASWEVNSRLQKPWGIPFPLLLSPYLAQGRTALAPFWGARCPGPAEHLWGWMQPTEEGTHH